MFLFIKLLFNLHISLNNVTQWVCASVFAKTTIVIDYTKFWIYSTFTLESFTILFFVMCAVCDASISFFIILAFSANYRYCTGATLLISYRIQLLNPWIMKSLPRLKTAIKYSDRILFNYVSVKVNISLFQSYYILKKREMEVIVMLFFELYFDKRALQRCRRCSDKDRKGCLVDSERCVSGS